MDVAADGPAAAAGVRPQDHVLAINGKPLATADQLAAVLAALVPGDTVKLAVGRGTQRDELALQAISRPSRGVSRDWQAAEPKQVAPPPTAIAPRAAPRLAEPAAMPTPHTAVPTPTAPQAAKGRTALGVRTLPVDPAVQARFNLPEPAGALVVGVVHDLPASKAGVPPGAVIVALDNQPVRSPSELTKIVTTRPVDRPVTLQYVLPGGESRRADVSLQSLEVPLERALVGPEPTGPQR